MPNRFVPRSPKRRAKPEVSNSIRHDPEFGIAPQIMRGKFVDARALRSGFHHMPDRFRRDPRAPNFTHSVYAPKNRSGADFGG